MAKSKAFIVDWLAEARALAACIDEIGGPPGLLVDRATWQPDRTKLAEVERLMRMVQVYLTDRINRKTPAKKPERGNAYGVFTDDPAQTFPLWEMFTRDLGLQFDDAATRAFVAHNMLGQVLRDGWIDKFLRKHLPLQVASIAGESKSASKSKSASATRPNADRRSPLSKIVAAERRRDPDATAGEVLDRICNGGDEAVREVVKAFSAGRLWYLDKGGKPKSVGLDRFETIFSEQRPKLAKACKSKPSTG